MYQGFSFRHAYLTSLEIISREMVFQNTNLYEITKWVSIENSGLSSGYSNTERFGTCKATRKEAQDGASGPVGDKPGEGGVLKAREEEFKKILKACHKSCWHVNETKTKNIIFNNVEGIRDLDGFEGKSMSGVDSSHDTKG